jgi:hypothetical protein
MSDSFDEALTRLDEAGFQDLYGAWRPIAPTEVRELFDGTSLRWWVAGGHAARLGAQPRRHEDLDVVVRFADLDALRHRVRAWHLWEANDGALRPLLPGVAITPECEQLWLRRSATQPWRLDVLLDRSADQWTFKRDPSVRVPWSRAIVVSAAIPYLAPELALLHKAHLDRPKDRDDLANAVLEPDRRRWLATTLSRLGFHEWSDLALPGA